MTDGRRDKSRTIDDEFKVVMLTWEEQERRRRRILRRLHGLATRFASEEAAARAELREHARTTADG